MSLSCWKSRVKDELLLKSVKDEHLIESGDNALEVKCQVTLGTRMFGVDGDHDL